MTCTFVHTTIGSFELGDPRPEPYWISSVYTRLVRQVVLLSGHFSFQTPVKCRDIRKGGKAKVFPSQSPSPRRHARRPAAALLK